MSLLAFVLAAFGLTQILVYGKILNRVRPTKGFLGDLFRCPMCLGFWVGCFIWFVDSYTSLFTFDNSILTGFLLGCISSGTSYILCTLFGDEGININEIKRRND